MTKGRLRPTHIITVCNSLIPLGGPPICGLSQRSYFPYWAAMLSQVCKLAECCERTWTHKIGVHRTHTVHPYEYRPRKTESEVEAHTLQRALQGNLQVGVAPALGHVMPAKGEGGGGVPPLGQTCTP